MLRIICYGLSFGAKFLDQCIVLIKSFYIVAGFQRFCNFLIYSNDLGIRDIGDVLGNLVLYQCTKFGKNIQLIAIKYRFYKSINYRKYSCSCLFQAKT